MILFSPSTIILNSVEKNTPLNPMYGCTREGVAENSALRRVDQVHWERGKAGSSRKVKKKVEKKVGC